MRFEGSCQCGAVAYSFEAERLLGYCCHCLECRKQSASAFGTTVPMLGERLQWSGLAPSRWDRAAHSGETTACMFCPTCGGRLVHQDAASPEHASIKAGGLSEADQLEIVGHLWTRRRLPGLDLTLAGDLFETQPDDLASWRQAIVERAIGVAPS